MDPTIPEPPPIEGTCSPARRSWASTQPRSVIREAMARRRRDGLAGDGHRARGRVVVDEGRGHGMGGDLTSLKIKHADLVADIEFSDRAWRRPLGGGHRRVGAEAVDTAPPAPAAT